MPANVTFDKLAAISIFKGLPPETLAPLAATCRSVTLETGQVLFRQGDPAKTLYLIEEGQVQIVREYESADQIILATLGPNEVVGELSMIVGEPRTASVIALMPTRLIVLDRTIFFDYLGRYPGMAIQVLMQLGRRLQRMNLRVRELAADKPAARLASAILFLAEEQGEIKTGLITANFRPHRMARAAGIDPISMNELLKEWSSAGYIEVDRQRLLLHDVKAMQKIAGWE